MGLQLSTKRKKTMHIIIYLYNSSHRRDFLSSLNLLEFWD
jgi:hypothetical protein